jgi:predicted amidohydrolase
MPLERIRVATLQYFIRPVQTFEQFADQVSGLVETAADYKCHLLVFPEYFTLQLLTLGDLKRPIKDQIRTLAAHGPRFVELMGRLAKQHGLYIVAGTIPVAEDDAIYNQCYFFAPDGSHQIQGKLHMTRFEAEEWFVQPRDVMRVFDTELGRIAIAICYDCEFPEVVRAAAHQDAHILVVPSCTDDRQGYLRVRYCAQARAIENQMYVIVSSTVGSLPMVPAVSLNYGQAAILTPSDFAFARDGILAEGVPNQESMVIGELNLKTIVEARTSGTVLPLVDSKRSAMLARSAEVVTL